MYAFSAHIKTPRLDGLFVVALLSDLEPQCEERSNKDEQKQTKKNRQCREANEKTACMCIKCVK